ncbi:LysR family transcriptional regulator [Alishewanella sp. SMS8]|uniref:LysR family transcriptional regulator n=1 Tax=Alishewanella sp. SMS8 TaxID=2994676 RepID=UPI00274229B8|nr:LysR family transcriptional regulator [Alishewanella sp. SMS8]MDP4945742.1 LysR family transcriptional regulator [Alishewanella sp.]MDP5187178.1 LysR family transcriptional regulator [Alishewanella sp.]MDP5459150.1 LysR family transcriptional regulator [Alishewanella sp. SMS8]
MSRLNYHHLYYFWQVARGGNLTETAQRLHISQSALSAQIKQFEQSMQVQLFSRQGRRLVLTDSGYQTLKYAEDIFSRGEELEQLLLKGMQPQHNPLRIGTLATMSRNFIESFIAPLLLSSNVRYSLFSMNQTALLNALAAHQLDLVLSNIAVQGTDNQLWQCRLLARQPVAVIGPPGKALPENLAAYQQQRWVLPPVHSPIRTAFDALAAQYQLQPDVVAEADDMAMLRLLTRDSGALSVIPEVVVKDELKNGSLEKYLMLPEVYENFYFITTHRELMHPQQSLLLDAFDAQRLSYSANS